VFNLLYGPIAALVLLGIAPGDFEGFAEIVNLTNGVGTVLILFAGLLFGSGVAGYAAGWLSPGHEVLNAVAAATLACLLTALNLAVSGGVTRHFATFAVLYLAAGALGGYARQRAVAA
jgi:hypothetical protein